LCCKGFIRLLIMSVETRSLTRRSDVELEGRGLTTSSPRGAVSEYTFPVALEPPSVALVVIDMQYASACRATGFGRWLASEGRAEEGAYRFDRIEQMLVPNILRLLTFFRDQDLSRVFVRLGAQMGGCRDLIPHLRGLEAAFGNILGAREYEILDELAPQPGEPIVTKLSASAFTSSNIDLLLRNLGVGTLIFTGVSTSQCVDLTARDAADRGYGCLIVEDAVAEDQHDYHEATLEQFQRLFGRVASTDRVISELTTAVSRRTRTG
jgi:nicotinamidase-related amidase